MTDYILRRIIGIFPVLLGGSAIIFFSLRIFTPVDIIEDSLSQGVGASDEVLRDQLRREYGLDKPMLLQYVLWLGGAVRGDFGTSWATGQPVGERIFSSLPVSLEITLLSIVLAIVIGIPFGVASAVRLNTWLDYLVRFIAVVGLSVPSFVVATVLLVVPSLWWGWSPPVGYKAPWEDMPTHAIQMALPLIALAVGVAAVNVRMLRSTLLEVLRNDFIRTGRAKGLNERMVVARHGLKNALIPVVTIMGTQVSFTLGGSVVLENIFSLPGLGRLTLIAIDKGDFAQLQANILYLFLVYTIVNLLVDLSYAWLDPRIHYS
ncbi:MAG TPA: ABC transporter permease [Chloroflexota bacterium]|jgi:peptide/nickel transport system permease protein|nr:ABC transporter permease [Chloroflexota bacterium]